MTDVNPGPAALDAIFTRMLIDEQWSIRDSRRFRWWSGRYCQELLASEATISNGILVSRLIARTPIATGVALEDSSYQVLSEINAAAATVSAVVLGNDGVVSLIASAIVHEAVLSWLPDHFALVAAIQVAEAEHMGPGIASLLRGHAAATGHPTSGPRHTPDDLTTMVNSIRARQSDGPSQWSGAAMTDALAILQRTSLLATGDDTGATAEFPYRDFSSLLQFDTQKRHPSVGSGLHVTLKLWSPPFDRSPAESAALLNLIEAKGVSLMSCLHGGWCVPPDGKNDTVAFHAFFPDIFYREGMAANIALWMTGKAQWIASLNDPRSDEERRTEGRPAIARILDWDDLEVGEE